MNLGAQVSGDSEEMIMVNENNGTWEGIHPQENTEASFLNYLDYIFGLHP